MWTVIPAKHLRKAAQLYNVFFFLCALFAFQQNYFYVYFRLFICKALLMEFTVNNIISKKFTLGKVLWLKRLKALSEYTLTALIKAKNR